MVKKITPLELEQIQSAVQKAEKMTRGEIVPVAMTSADDYQFVLYRTPLLLSFALSGGLFFFIQPLSAGALFLAQMIILGGSYVLLRQFSFLKYFLLTNHEIEQEINRKSLELFYKYDLQKTAGRTGILITVFIEERRVRILADEGINRLVPEKTWDLVVSDMISEIKNKDLTSAIMLGVKRCGEILSQKIPAQRGNPNELNDNLRTK